MDRHHGAGGYGGAGRNIRDDDVGVYNFSLNYRHMEANNTEQYKLLLTLHIRVIDRKTIRLLVYENDNVKELGNRLIGYMAQH